MNKLISIYINKLTKDDINRFATSKNAYLSNSELDFTYNYIKTNWQSIINNPNDFDFKIIERHYTKENFLKIKEVFNEYLLKYKNYL